MAENHNDLFNGVAQGLQLRDAVGVKNGQLDIRRCEVTGSVSMRHVWFSDCQSLFSYFVSPDTKQVDNKRSAIDLSAQISQDSVEVFNIFPQDQFSERICEQIVERPVLHVDIFAKKSVGAKAAHLELW